MKKQVIGLCAVALIAVTAALGASGALNARQNDTQPVQTEAPVQTVEPAQNTPEAVQSEPARPGKKVNMDDTKWADAIEELNDYIDQQIGGDKSNNDMLRRMKRLLREDERERMTTDCLKRRPFPQGGTAVLL